MCDAMSEDTTIRPFIINNCNAASNSTCIDMQDLKAINEETKSNKSVVTSKSTREVFDLLAKALPIGILLLIISLMVHFVTFVRDIEPWRSVSEIICMALAATVIPLSIVFILRSICGSCTRRAYWYSSYECNCSSHLNQRDNCLPQNSNE